MIKLYKKQIEAEQHFLVVKDLIQFRIRNIIQRGIKRDKNPLTLSPNFTIYLRSLLVDIELKTLITAEPSTLQGIVGVLRISNRNFFVPGHDENFVLRNIFVAHCYDNPSFSKLDFIKRIEIDTCPYCNRNYIYYLSKNNKIKPQIDHFYPKSTYPILAASFYNLIPSCQTCNGFGAKEEKDPIDEGLVNPYLLDDDSFKFTYKIKTINFLNPILDKASVQVKFRNQIPGHLNLFKLEKLYEQHSDHVLELVIKSKVEYSKLYRDYLKSYKELNFSDIEIDRMILGNYTKENEVHKRPLAKLYQDIGRELGLII